MTVEPQQVHNASVKSQLRLLLGLAVLAVVMVASPGSAGFGGGVTPVSAQGVELSLDTDISDGPCVDIDSELTTSVDESFQIAICAAGLYSPGMAFFQTDVLYDDTILLAPEVADDGLGVDDNPDANAGATTWGASLGERVDCSSGQAAFPRGNRSTTPGKGRAFVSCVNLLGPWPLGEEVDKGVLAVITFKALKEGTVILSAERAQLGDSQAIEMGSCKPTATLPMLCNDATIQVLEEGQAPPPSGGATVTVTAAPPEQGGGATPPSERAATASSEGGGRNWLLPAVIGIVVAVVVVGLLSLVFYRRRRQAA